MEGKVVCCMSFKQAFAQYVVVVQVIIAYISLLILHHELNGTSNWH